MRKRRLWIVFAGVVMVCALMACPGARALDPALDVSQYAHTSWKVRDGFVKGTISAIAQTPDGYLWLGTEFGLHRFDGVRAVPWQPPSGEQLPSNYIRSLLVTRDGALWIATVKGLASWKEGKLTNYPETAGQVTLSLLQDREGTVWFGMFLPGRLCSIQGGKVQCSGARSFGDFVAALYEDSKSNLWVSSAAGLWRWKPGPPDQYPSSGDLFAEGLIESDGGALLLATVKGLKQVVGDKIQNYALPGVTATAQFRPGHFLRSSDGGLWIGSSQGLLHLHQGRTDLFGAADGLSGDGVWTIFEDREGSVWVSTREGLDRFREYAVSTISRNQGLSTSGAYSVQATTEGTIWIGTSNGLNRWQNGHVIVYRKRSGPDQSVRRNEPELSISGTVREIADSGFVGTPRSLGLDDRGRLWVSSGDGVFYFESGRFIRVPGVPGGNIWSIIGDGHGETWFSNGNLGLFGLTPENTVQQIPWSRFGQTPSGGPTLLPDQSQGGVWLGFSEGGVDFFKDGQVRASYTVADGLGNGRVTHLRFGSRGAVWAATEGGLSRIQSHQGGPHQSDQSAGGRDGHIETLSSKNGLPCDQVHWSMEDDDHSMWLYMPCGLARIERSEWYAWADDPRHVIKTMIFDASDGVREVGLYGGYGPHVTKAPDGKIWFVHRDGVSVIDPHYLPFNKIPPPVHIEQITADRKTSDVAADGIGEGPASEGGRYKERARAPLPARIRDLEIDYTALSLVAPEKVRFRYKLEGLDRDWQDVGNRRQAFYTNLPPLKYRFRVAACNNSGVWNEAGAFLDFSVAPAYYQTTWFRLSCVAAFLALLWAVYQQRLRQATAQVRQRLEGRFEERERIARELHDTLLQSFQGLLLRLQSGINVLPDRPDVAKERLERAADQAEQAIVEGRNAVQGLRLSTIETNDLAAALNTLAVELAANQDGQNSPAFGIQVEGASRDLHPILRDDAYRIVGEALRNAFMHAQASRVEVEILYDERQLRVRVRDDGKGIDSQIVTDKGRPGHWGLRGMHERAKLVGGNLQVWSKPDSGTEIELTIPASTAYASSRTRLVPSLSKKRAATKS